MDFKVGDFVKAIDVIHPCFGGRITEIDHDGGRFRTPVDDVWVHFSWVTKSPEIPSFEVGESVYLDDDPLDTYRVSSLTSHLGDGYVVIGLLNQKHVFKGRLTKHKFVR